MSIMDIQKRRKKMIKEIIASIKSIVNVFRNSRTVLTDQELAYCEHDCLAEYYRYIEKIIYIKTVFIFTLLWIFTKNRRKEHE